jgi:hypothetical protein
MIASSQLKTNYRQMRTNNIYKIVWSVFFFALLFNACKKDEPNSKELMAFMTSGGNDLHAVNLAFTRTPISSFGDSIAKFAVGLTRETNSEVLVNIAPDEGKVSSYNNANKTNFVLLPTANYTILNGTQAKIPSGSTISVDSLKLEIKDRINLSNDNGYILPLSIRGISTKDKGITASNNYGTVYVIIKGTYSNIDRKQSALTGQLTARTGWTVTVSNTTAGALGPALIDGVNTTAWRSSNSSSAAKWLSIDMNSTQQIKGFQLVPNYIAVAENPTTIRVSTSMDNVKWDSQGEWKGTGPTTGSSATSPDLKNINFISPVQARYFRFDITTWTSGSRVGISELNVVQ